MIKLIYPRCAKLLQYNIIIIIIMMKIIIIIMMVVLVMLLMMLQMISTDSARPLLHVPGERLKRLSPRFEVSGFGIRGRSAVAPTPVHASATSSGCARQSIRIQEQPSPPPLPLPPKMTTKLHFTRRQNVILRKSPTLCGVESRQRMGEWAGERTLTEEGGGVG